LVEAVSADLTATSEAARLMTAEEVGERWQLPEGAVYRMTREGLLPTVKLGRYYRYRVADIEAFEVAGGAQQMDKPFAPVRFW
jgi:excisionase family DNA binding protein